MEKFVLIPERLWNNYQAEDDGTLKPVVKRKITPNHNQIEEKTQKSQVLMQQLATQKVPAAKSIVESLSKCNRIKFSELNTIILDNVDTLVFIIPFVKKLLRQRGTISDVELAILEAAGIDRNIVENRDAKRHEVGSWIPFTF